MVGWFYDTSTHAAEVSLIITVSNYMKNKKNVSSQSFKRVNMSLSQTALYDPLIEPLQRQVRVELGVMITKAWLLIPQTSSLPDTF